MRRSCPIGKAAEILGRKWTLEITYYLQTRRRFGELQETLGGLNPVILSRRLKMLESAGMVKRYPVSDAPRHVEYGLTEKGRDLISVLDILADWVHRWYPDEGT